MFDVIERLKSEWTDKYVVINSSAPELARFAHATGTVKTVNMNGRCLVEFDQFNNTGWYDIDPTALKIVPKPEPKPAAEKEEKPAKAAPAAKAPAAKAPPAPGAKKPSTADILAAARGKAGGTAPAEPSKPAAGGKLSTAEILARARAAKASVAPPAAEEPAAPAEPEPEAAPVASKAAAPKPAASGLPKATADRMAGELKALASPGTPFAGWIPALAAINAQAPTAELRPGAAGQTDEGDLMPYDVLDRIERLAIRDKELPLAAWQRLVVDFPQHEPRQLAAWTERFYVLWSRNQWKRERYAPSFHLDDENLDPKTWCRWPILSGGFQEELETL
jgi:hypothetical protein